MNDRHRGFLSRSVLFSFLPRKVKTGISKYTINLQKTFCCRRMIQVDQFHGVYQSKNIIIWKNSSGRLFLNHTLKVHNPQSLPVVNYINHFLSTLLSIFYIIVLWVFFYILKTVCGKAGKFKFNVLFTGWDLQNIYF